MEEKTREVEEKTGELEEKMRELQVSILNNYSKLLQLLLFQLKNECIAAKTNQIQQQLNEMEAKDEQIQQQETIMQTLRTQMEVH